MTIALLAVVCASLAAGCRHLLCQRRFLHLLQLEHYENTRLRIWLQRRREFFDPRELGVEFVLAAAVLALTAARLDWPTTVSSALLAVVLLRWARREYRRPTIKPLVFTPRAKRLFCTASAPVGAMLLIGLVLAVVADSVMPMAVGMVLVVVANQLAAPLLMLANAGLRPVERRVNEGFVRSAKAKLAEVSPRVVGITGSYGKTTTKMCIGAVLSVREATLVTPASFNSFLGVVRAINEHLRPAHRNFVVEMGMYRRGDIAELCHLVHPTIGVLTAVGPMHLERLGSIEAIADAKAELAEALPADGHLVVNGDDPWCEEIAERVSVETTRYGIDSARADVCATELLSIGGRTRFDLRIGGVSAQVETKLLGRHNVSNLLAAAAVGHLLGMSIDEIKVGLENLEPPAHRLQPIRNEAAGILVIDDAYNSNPAGAAAALEVLKSHPARRRILVTPGMVELGDQEQKLNEQFGRQAADACDYVILVGPSRTKPVAEGLRSAGFDLHAVQVVRDIAAATKALASLTRSGDVVLFENDLPDLYAEDPLPPVVSSL